MMPAKMKIFEKGDVIQRTYQKYELPFLLFSFIIPICKDALGFSTEAIFIYWAIVILALTLLAFFRYRLEIYKQSRNKFLESVAGLYLDYKFVAPYEKAKIFFEHLGCLKLTSTQPFFLAYGSKDYIDSSRFFDPAEGWCDDFQCVTLTNIKKQNQCIIQCSFIPIDPQGNIPLILRKGENHSFSISPLDKSTELAFISFSPIPFTYKDSFSAEKCYFREVPYSSAHDLNLGDFEEYCIQISKIEKEGEKPTYYIFYTYLVHYQKSFRDKAGNIDWQFLYQLFALNPTDNSEKIFFKKDHDPIIGVANIRDLSTAAWESDKPSSLSVQYVNEIYNNGIRVSHALKPIELTCIKKLGHKYE